jgi:tetratricopeptide (TPR) repeat protein
MVQVRQLAAEGKVRSALEEALFAVQSAPSYLPLHVLIGELLLQDDHPAEAVHKFQVVARLYNIRGETNRAVRLMKRISQINPSDLTIRQQIIDLLVAQDKIEEALKECQSLADLYYSLAELDKARQTYLDALKVAQKSKDNRVWGVTLLMKVADIDLQRLNLRQALRIFEQIRTIQPDNHDVRIQLVGLNFRLGQDQPGMKELDDYANFLEGQNRRKEAISFINELLAENEKRLDLRRRLADLLIRDGQKEKAVEELDRVADSLLNEGKHLEAINMLELIVSLNPPNVSDYRTALNSIRRDSLRK